MTEPAVVCILGHAEPAETFIGLACRRHYHWIGDTLREIETLFALRTDVILPGAGDGIRSGTRSGSPAPGRLALMSITDKRVAGRKPPMTPERNLNPQTGRLESNGADDEIDVMGVLGGWFRIVIEERPNANPPRPHGPTCGMPCGHVSCARARGFVSLTTIVRVLGSERKWIAHQPWLDLYAEELGDAHRAIATAIGDSKWAVPVGKCPNDQAPLFNTIGADEITCRRCRYTWSGVHLARLRLIHEQEAK